VTEGAPLIDWDWIFRHLDDVANRTIQHLQLTIIPVALGFVISLFLAIWAVRQPRVYGPLLAVSGLLYTIPSLAAFALLRPFTGLTLLTAVIPLTTYTLLILVRANVAGFNSVPSDVIEAAEGMGYSRRERLLRVELPLALPMIMAGIRLAVVTTIGLATVASILGESFGGFGYFITEGLDRFFLTEIYVGAVLSIVMAFAADFLLVRVERLITPWARAKAQAR
jgi:osmoprotectant transport system permease protein